MIPDAPMPRRAALRTQVSAVLVAVAIGLPVWFSAHARAWWRFPALPEMQVSASLADAAGLPDFTAFDARGEEIALGPTAPLEARPGPCIRRYARADDGRSGPRAYLHLRGVATFDCLYELTVEGHGPVRAVIRTRLLTDPPAHFHPEGRALTGAEARRRLAQLDGRR